MSIRMRHTSQHRRERRAHHALVSVQTTACKKCQSAVMPHRVCTNCGTYKGREVIDVLAKLTKKERKKKEKELKDQESDSADTKGQSLEALSQK